MTPLSTLTGQTGTQAYRQKEAEERLSPYKHHSAHEAGWTEDRVELLIQFWADGFSAAKCAEMLGGGVTRNGVIGKVNRLSLKKRRTTVSAWSYPEYRKPPKLKAPRVTRSNFIIAPPAPKAKVVVALPVKGVKDSDLVAGWLAQNGGPRKFARGDSSTPDEIVYFLRERGFEATYSGWKSGMRIKVMGARGKPKKLTMRELIGFVDAIRRSEGMEPIAA